MDSKVLKDKRQRIDQLDQELLQLFLDRLDLVETIGQIKLQNDLPIFDKVREEEIIEKRLSAVRGLDQKQLTKDFFEKLFSISKNYQKNTQNLKIGYLGGEGSYSHSATKKIFKKGDLLAYRNFGSIFESVEKKEIKYGVLPIENTSTGSITAVYDLLKTYDLKIIGEVCLSIKHQLLGVKGATVTDLKKVCSHPQGIYQSKSFLDAFNWEITTVKSTSKAAATVSENNDKSFGCIASKNAAEIYDLEVLKENINDQSQNITRFIVISKEMVVHQDNNKISLGFSVKHEPGALYQVLKIFHELDINLLKIESRPIIDRPFEYYFYVDIEGNLKSEVIQKSFEMARKNTKAFRVFGNYSKNNTL